MAVPSKIHSSGHELTIYTGYCTLVPDPLIACLGFNYTLLCHKTASTKTLNAADIIYDNDKAGSVC